MTPNNATDASLWIQPHVGQTANVLLLGSHDATSRGDVCQRLLTTVSYADERVLAIQCGDTSDTWLYELKYVPATLTIKRCAESEETISNDLSTMREAISDFIRARTDGQCIVYVDSIDPVLKYADSVTAYNALRGLAQLLREGQAIGFFRVDPRKRTRQEIEAISKLFDFTAELTDNSRWRLIGSDRSAPLDDR